MKLWATIAVAGILAGSALATGSTKKALQSDAPSKWSINVGFALPESDHKDLGFDSMFSVGADWNLTQNYVAGSAQSYVGVLAQFGSGDASLDSTTYGIHYGVLFGLGAQNAGWQDFSVRLQAGYYNTKLKDDFGDEDKWGFGGLVGLTYMPKGNGFSITGGYYIYPEVSSVDNRGFTIAVGIPIK